MVNFIVFAVVIAAIVLMYKHRKAGKTSNTTSTTGTGSSTGTDDNNSSI